jgi:hypothetical protein
MTFEEYLITKKIDETTFRRAEPDLYESWRMEFEHVHPNSFTAQKLYLINPLRRKYLLKQEPAKIAEEKNEKITERKNEVAVEEKPTIAVSSPNPLPEDKINQPEEKPAVQSAKPARPVFKPKPKIN